MEKGTMLQLILSIVGVIGLVALGWLFLEFSKPGKRTVPVLIIVASVAAAILLFRVFPPLALVVGVFGIAIGFVVAAVSGKDCCDHDRQHRER
jgi:amino acid transporter